MRPIGETRLAVVQAATALIEERRALGAGCGGPHGVTAHLVAPRAQVQFDVARYSLRRAADAGELVVLRTERVSGVCRPVVVYGLPRGVAEARAALDAAAAADGVGDAALPAPGGAAAGVPSSGGAAAFDAVGGGAYAAAFPANAAAAADDAASLLSAAIGGWARFE